MARMKTGLLLLVLCMLTGLLAACGGGNNNNNGASGTNATKEPSATASPDAGSANKGGDAGSGGEKKTVQFWHSLGGKNGEFMDAAIKRFNDSHPNIEVVGTYQGGYDDTVTKLQQAVSANTAPDVTMIERGYVELFADSDVLEDLKPYMDGSNMNVNDFSAGLMGHSTFNDKLVSLPLNRSTPILHVNKKLLDEKGLAVPTTWEEMKKVAEAMTVKENGEFKRYGLTMPYDTWYPIAMISESDGKFFNDDKTSIDFLDNGIGEKVFGTLKDMQKTGALYYPPAQDSGNIVNTMFTEGKVAMMFQSTGTIGSLANNVDFDYVTAFMPQDKKYAVPTGGGNISMMSGSKNKDAAWEFINWLMTDDGGALQFILDSGYLPFTKTMVESDKIKQQWASEPNRKVAYDQLQYAVDTNKDVAWPEVMHEFFSAIEAIMYDSKDIKSSLETFKKEAERILAG